MIFLAIAIGGALGAVARYQVWRWVQPVGVSFPWATLLINVSGSLLLAFIYRYIEATTGSAQMRAFLGIGFCGAFTTFSTFSYETVLLFQNGEAGRASVYVAASVLLCLAGTLMGFRLAESILRAQ
jgi:fluoride exporter